MSIVTVSNDYQIGFNNNLQRFDDVVDHTKCLIGACDGNNTEAAILCLRQLAKKEIGRIALHAVDENSPATMKFLINEGICIDRGIQQAVNCDNLKMLDCIIVEDEDDYFSDKIIKCACKHGKDNIVLDILKRWIGSPEKAVEYAEKEGNSALAQKITELYIDIDIDIDDFGLSDYDDPVEFAYPKSMTLRRG